MRVLLRWLWYTLAGFVILLAMTGGGDVGSDDPKREHWRSILLTFAGLITMLVGLGAYLIAQGGGDFGVPWPAIAAPSWFISGCLTIAAWLSIARDLRREKHPTRYL